MPVDYLTLMQRWPRFGNRLSAALQRQGAALRRQGGRLEIDMGIYTQRDTGFGVDAGITLKQDGARAASIAALHVVDLPERPDEASLRLLARQLNNTALAWQRGERPLQGLPVFTYPPEKHPVEKR